MEDFRDRLDLARARSTQVYGAWIYDWDGDLDIVSVEGWPVEGAYLSVLIPGKFDPADIPDWLAKDAAGHILAIGTGQGFTLFDLR